MGLPGLAYDWVEIGTSDFGTLGQHPNTPERGLLVEPLRHYLDNLPDGINIQKVNAAVCASDGTALVYHILPETIQRWQLPEWLRGCNRMFAPHPLARPELTKAGLDPDEHIKASTVETVTWQTLVRRARIGRVTYLKIDTEGGEREIIVQVLRLAAQHPDLYPDRIMFETNANSTPSDIAASFRELEQHGYKVMPNTPDCYNAIAVFCGNRVPGIIKTLPKIALFSSVSWALGQISRAVAAHPSNLYDLRVVYWDAGIDWHSNLTAGGYSLIVVQTLAMAETVLQSLPALADRVAAVCHGPVELSPEWIEAHGGGLISDRPQIPIGAVSLELVEMIISMGGQAMQTPCGVDTKMFAPHDSDVNNGPLRVLFPRKLDPAECHAATKRIELVGRLVDHFRGHEGVKVQYFDRQLDLAEMPAAYRAADVVLILSKSEGNPLAALEGPACGTTLVTTPVGIIPELVTDGLNAFIVRGGSNDELFNAVVVALERLANNRGLLEEAKKSLTSLVRTRRSWDAVCMAWEEFFRRALKAAV
jgi:FkbM family methyltransferase